jgi:methylmalonyl-CoA/ethylmalonyl-CoA epimerase
MNISSIDHIAIVVKSISEVSSFYEGLGLKIAHVEELAERGIKTAFIPVGPVMIELIEPMRENSEVAKFIKKRGPGLHHIAFKIKDIKSFEKNLREKQVIFTHERPSPGANNTLVNFIHPKSTGGVLLEIVE